MTGTVLYIEDDVAIRRVVQLALSNEGFRLVEASTAGEGLTALRDLEIDVVLLDLMLPDGDGLDVCREIRRFSDIPIIMVTARADSEDVIAGLEAGADDYVTKPFVAGEVAARIRAHLRRTVGTANDGVVALGELEIAPQKGIATQRGEVIALTRTEFGLLHELASDHGRVFSREELLDRVWGHEYFGDVRLVDVYIRRLRVKVEDDPAQPRLVQTVRGVGYRLDD